MKTRIVLALVSLFCFASLVKGQETEPASGMKVGIGLSFNTASLVILDDDQLLLGNFNIQVPIRISSSLRLEPEVGLYSYSSESSSGGSTYSSSSSMTRLTAGLFFSLTGDESFSSYVGPRAGFIWMSSESSFPSGPSGQTTTRTMKRSDFLVAGCLGGEYFFSPHFSMGGEAQLNYISFGEPEFTYDPPPSSPSTSVSTKASMVATGAVVFLRWYF